MANIDTRIANYRNKKPATPILWSTIEFYSSAIGIKRYVNEFADKTFTIEFDAPRNAGESVLFTAVAFTADDPAQSNDPRISINITIERIGSTLKDAIKNTTGFGGFEPIEVIVRRYLSDDTSAPVQVFYLYARNLTMDGRAVSIVASDENPLTQGISTIATPKRFEGLIDL